MPTRPMSLETPTKSTYQVRLSPQLTVTHAKYTVKRALISLVWYYTYKLTINDLYKKYVMKKSKFLPSHNNSEIFTVNIGNQSI